MEKDSLIANLEEQLSEAAYLSENLPPQSNTGTTASGSGSGTTTGTTEQQPQTPAPGTVMPGGVIWEGGGGELSDTNGWGAGINWQ